MATRAVSPEAEIVVEREPLAEGGERLTVKAVYSGDAADLTYRFTTLKEGGGGQSRSEQSGVVAGAGTLATSSVRVGVRDVFTAHLVLYKGNQTVSEVRWSDVGQ